jgi:hypothetical protein
MDITLTTIWMAILVLFVIFLGLTVRRVQRTIRCPIHGTDVRLEFFEALPEGRPVEVTKCSAFTPPTAITCNQRCLVQLAHPPARSEAQKA